MVKGAFETGVLVLQVIKIVDVITPEVVKMWGKFEEMWERLKPYHLQEWFPAIFGIFLVRSSQLSRRRGRRSNR